MWSFVVIYGNEPCGIQVFSAVINELVCINIEHGKSDVFSSAAVKKVPTRKTGCFPPMEWRNKKPWVFGINRGGQLCCLFFDRMQIT